SRRRHTRCYRDWSSDVCSSDLKKHMDSLRKTGQLTNSVLLESEKGHIIVEPANSHHGDGGVLAPDVADYELRPAWCRSPNTKVRMARELLGLAAVYA